LVVEPELNGPLPRARGFLELTHEGGQRSTSGSIEKRPRRSELIQRLDHRPERRNSDAAGDEYGMWGLGGESEMISWRTDPKARARLHGVVHVPGAAATVWIQRHGNSTDAVLTDGSYQRVAANEMVRHFNVHVCARLV